MLRKRFKNRKKSLLGADRDLKNEELSLDFWLFLGDNREDINMGVNEVLLVIKERVDAEKDRTL